MYVCMYVWHSSKPHNSPLCLSSLRRSRDVTTDIYIFNILNSYFSFICLVFYLSYIFVLYIYLFIHLFLFFYYFPQSAVRRSLCASAVRFLLLQTPAMMTDVEVLQNFREIRREVLANENPTCLWALSI